MERSTAHVARLKDPAPAVRRVAVRDLLAHSDATALALLADHLAHEDDAACIILIARGLAHQGHTTARAALAAKRDDPRTPITAYHACLLAHDELELRPPSP